MPRSPEAGGRCLVRMQERTTFAGRRSGLDHGQRRDVIQ